MEVKESGTVKTANKQKMNRDSACGSEDCEMKMIEEIRDELKKMDKQDTCLFILSLLGRQKNMFDKIAYINGWEGTEIIDRVFACVKSNVYEEQNLVYEEGVERTDIEYLGWETEEINMQIVNTFLDNLFAFVGMLQDKQNIDYAFPQCNFDLLESLIMNEIGWENANEEVIAANQHVQLEYTREKRDLEQIRKKTYLFETDNEMLIPFPFCLK